MNLDVFKEKVIAACEQQFVPVDSRFREAETVSECIPLVGGLLLGDMPESLNGRVRGLLLDAFPPETLADYGILVNPTEVVSGQKVDPWLVLLYGQEQHITQSYEGKVSYRGGVLSEIEVLNGTADLWGQCGVSVSGQASVFATKVAKVVATDQSKVVARGCPLVLGSDRSTLTLHDSYGEHHGAGQAVVEAGGRLLATEAGATVKVEWGGMALLQNENIMGFGDGVIIKPADMGELERTELAQRMRTLTPWSPVRYRPEMTLDELKNCYVSSMHTLLHNAFDLATGNELPPLIYLAKSKTELAALILPFVNQIVKVEPVDCLKERFAPELLAAYNIFTSSTPHLALNSAFPVHLFGNLAVDLITYGHPLYSHDTTVSVSKRLTPIFMSDQAMGIALGGGSLNGRDRSFGIVTGDSTGAFFDQSTFLARDRSTAMAYNKSRGVGRDWATVHGLGESKVQLMDRTMGYLSYNSSALVYGPEVRFMAEGNSWVNVKGAKYGDLMEVKFPAVMTRITQEADWDKLVKEYSKEPVKVQKQGLHM